MSALLPEGCSNLRDVPYLWLDAVKFGLLILSFDELPSEERPPRRIWRDGEALQEWFEDVSRKRDEKYGLNGHKPIEDPVDNEAAKALIVE